MVFSVARRGASRTALSVRLLRKHHLELVRLLVGQTLSAIMNGSVVASYTTFVQRELNAGATDLAVIILLTAMTGAISLRVFMPLISRLTPGRLRLAMLLSKAATPAWPLWVCFGMRRKWEIFLLPVAGAMVNSQILPMIRTIFQQCLPHGFEASLFSMLGVCTVAFTWIGSLIIGALLAATGSLRWGMLAVSAFGFLGVAVLSRFDFEAAMESRRKIEAWVGADGSEFAELRTNPGVGFGNAESREEEHIGEGDDAAPREGGKKTAAATTLKTGRADA
jgi:UMF1 family MFS transporter